MTETPQTPEEKIAALIHDTLGTELSRIGVAVMDDRVRVTVPVWSYHISGISLWTGVKAGCTRYRRRQRLAPPILWTIRSGPSVRKERRIQGRKSLPTLPIACCKAPELPRPKTLTRLRSRQHLPSVSHPPRRSS